MTMSYIWGLVKSGYNDIRSKLPNNPNKVNNGTINISAPAPINPANIPLIIPVNVKPKI